MSHGLPEAHAVADMVAPDVDPNCALAVAIDLLLTGEAAPAR